MNDGDVLLRAIEDVPLLRRTGTVVEVRGDVLTVAGMAAQTGELISIEGPAGVRRLGEAVRVRGTECQVALIERGPVAIGSAARALHRTLEAPVAPALVGRVLDGLGRPLDERPLPLATQWRPARVEPLAALERPPIRRRLATGVRAIDAFLTLGRGQRVGIFAGSGVGKSTLLGMLARGTEADVTVLALIGERGREVREFIEHDLGDEGLRRAVVVSSTSDTPAPLRLAAAEVATAIAEGFRDAGLDVLLLFDSLTRVAMAQREVGLASGEPPTTRGYPPSVFTSLPRLVERAGAAPRGSITAIYTVLVDGDDLDEPISDLARATLDGHIVLSRTLANAGHYPPIDVLASVSRLAPKVADGEHLAAARHLRGLLAAFEEARDLIAIGAYVRGSDPRVDEALELRPELERFLRQEAAEAADFEDTRSWLLRLARRREGAGSAAQAVWEDAT